MLTAPEMLGINEFNLHSTDWLKFRYPKMTDRLEDGRTLLHYHCGLTLLVERPTASAGQLRLATECP